MPIDDHYRGSQVESYEQRLAYTAHALRRLADRIEQEGKPHPRTLENKTLPYSYAAGHVVHEITWGVANLNLETLLYWAASADEAPIITREPLRNSGAIQ